MNTRRTRITATAVKTSNGVNSVTFSSLARKTMSGTAITDISVAPLNRPMKVLPSGGKTMRKAWGRMTCVYVRTRLSPIERATSI